MARTDLTKNLLSRYERLEGQRQNWETHWQEVADYMQPRKADVTKKRARGDKRMEKVFDSSPIKAILSRPCFKHSFFTEIDSSNNDFIFLFVIMNINLTYNACN